MIHWINVYDSKKQTSTTRNRLKTLQTLDIVSPVQNGNANLIATLAGLQLLISPVHLFCTQRAPLFLIVAHDYSKIPQRNEQKTYINICTCQHSQFHIHVCIYISLRSRYQAYVLPN